MKSDTVSIFSPHICHEVIGSDAMIFVFWMLNLSQFFSLSSFTFIRRLFSSSSLSAIKVLSSEYLRLLIFLLVILIPPCDSSSPTFRTMCSAYKLKIAAAAAKSLQSCPTLCDPIDGSPPGSSVPGILQARILEWVAISFSLFKAELCARCSFLEHEALKADSRSVPDADNGGGAGAFRQKCMAVCKVRHVLSALSEEASDRAVEGEGDGELPTLSKKYRGAHQVWGRYVNSDVNLKLICMANSQCKARLLPQGTKVLKQSGSKSFPSSTTV